MKSESILRYVLLLTVFITGAAVLVLEIVAVRVLAPYFGNTIFSVSSVISVILASLSIGYYIGGRFSDKHPTLDWFYGIITVSGLLVFVIYLLIIFALPSFGYNLSFVSGPLITALLLFFVPSFFLGTLSPYAITLQKKIINKGVGSVAGEIFFWSTLGSIVGSLLTGFYLIPSFGILEIIISTAVVLTVLGLAGFIAFRGKAIALFILLAIGLSLGINSYAVTEAEQSGVVFKKDGLYSRILIIDQEYNGQTARFLQLDKNYSGAEYLNSSDHVFEYSKYNKLYKLLPKVPKNILVIGGGMYTAPKTYLEALPDAHIDAVEIEPTLVGLSEEYFGLPRNERLEHHIKDGRQFLQQNSGQQYDIIFSDAYQSLHSVPAHLMTQEFFELAYDRLANDGFFWANFIADLQDRDESLFLSVVKTFQSVFPNSIFFATKSTDLPQVQNIVFVGFKNQSDLELLLAEATKSEDEFLSGLPDKVIDVEKYDLKNHIILTDNYAPTEYLTARLLRISLY